MSPVARERFLFKVTDTLSSSLDYRKTVNRVASLAVPTMADWCTVEIKEGNVIELLAVAHKDPNMVKWARALRLKDPLDLNSPHGTPKVIRTGKPEFYPHITDRALEMTARNKRELELAKKLALRSAMVVPLTSFNRTFGAITFIATHDRPLYTLSDLKLAEEIARRSAMAIDNALLYKAAEKEIDERKKAEKALQASYEKLTRLLETTSEAFFSLDKEGRYVYLNKNSIAYSGRQPAELLGRTMEEVFPRAKERTSYKKIQEVLKTRIPQEFEEKLADGWFEVKVYPYDEGVAVFYRDVSDRKQLEQRKDEFISMASHELKTPITSLKLYTELMRKSRTATGRGEYVGHMLEEVRKLDKLVNDLLDVSRMQIGKLNFKKETCDLQQIVRAHVKIFRKTEPSHSIVYQELKGKIPLRADKDRIGQVVANLLSNAIKYSPHASKIVVKLARKKNSAVLSVKDFGVGIEVDSQKKIFNRFFQVASRESHTFPGLGIGLYISKIIADKHNARIDVESVPGKGSTFYFTIPMHEKK